MAPKKAMKPKAAPANAPCAGGLAQPHGTSTINAAYHAAVRADLWVITEKYPTLLLAPSSPQVGETGFKGLVGFGATFDPKVYDVKIGNDEKSYACFGSLFDQDMYSSVLDWMPLYRERVVEYADTKLTTPDMLKEVVVLANFEHGKDLPKGRLMRLSPCEPVHAALYKFAQRIMAGAPESELNQWLRVMLSVQFVFLRLKGADALYAEANSLREDASSFARAVVLTVRQLVYNIQGFKKNREGKCKEAGGAAAIAKFWSESVRVSTDNMQITKKSTIDTCLTLYDRVFSIDAVESIIKGNESKFGQSSWVNHMYKLQEVVYRCQKESKIVWVMAALDDGVHSGRYENEDITMSALKTGKQSITDVVLTGLALKNYLLGSWLDGRDFPAYIKSKAREIFNSHASWRALYQPSDQSLVLDTTWLFRWPKVGRDLLEFIEGTVFLPTASEEHLYRQAVKNSTTPAELMATKPWIDTIQLMADQLTATAAPGTIASTVGNAPGSTCDGHINSDTINDNDANNDPSKKLMDSVQLVAATHKLQKQQSAYINEQPSLNAMKQLYEDTPLALVKPSEEGGNVMILFDCNTWGETDVQPDRRSVPIHKDKFDVPLRSILTARYGTDEPEELTHGEFFVCVNGGKDRKRAFTKVT